MIVHGFFPLAKASATLITSIVPTSRPEARPVMGWFGVISSNNPA